jgi:hypothetical protein
MRGAISAHEGMNMATDRRTAVEYIPSDSKGVVMAIDVSKVNVWGLAADSYPRTSEDIPVSAIIAVSDIMDKKAEKEATEDRMAKGHVAFDLELIEHEKKKGNTEEIEKLKASIVRHLEHRFPGDKARQERILQETKEDTALRESIHRDYPTAFEKARKGLPDGTRRKYGKNWFVKMGGNWVYDGSADPKRSTSNVGARSKVRAAAQQATQAADTGYSPISQQEFDATKAKFTRRDRIGEGQEVKYTGRYHKHLQGRTGKLVAIGPGGFAMVQFPGGKVESAAWRDVSPVGKIQPHSLYDKVDMKNVYKVNGNVKKVLDKTMKQKIGGSNMNYYDLANEFKSRGFNLQVVGGTVRDILSEKDEVKDVDFIFNGTDRELFAIVNDINPAWVRNAVTNKHLGLCSFTDGSDVVDITPVHKYSPEMRDMAKGWNLYDDATSRDLAMNSLQVDPLSGIMCDPTGNGINDIKNETIDFCHVGALKVAPRYILRAFKFMARGYKVSDAADKAIKQNLGEVNNISPKQRESFLRRQIADKDGLKGLDAFKATFKKYNANLWDRGFERSWRTVYRQAGGRP